MKSPVLRLLTTLLILCFVVGGVLWHRANIAGHWHVAHRTGSGFEQMYTFDVDWIEDDLGMEGAQYYFLVNRTSEGAIGIGGGLNRLRRNIYLFPTCLSMRVTYHRWGDSLYLQETDYNWLPTGDEAVAYQCHEGCCDPQADFMAVSKLKVDLPIHEKGNACNEDFLDARALEVTIIVGRNSSGEWESYLGSRPLKTRDDVALFLEQHAVKLPERLRPLMTLRFFADRDAPQSMLDSLQHVFQDVQPGLGVERVYRDAVLKRPLKLYSRPQPENFSTIN